MFTCVSKYPTRTEQAVTTKIPDDITQLPIVLIVASFTTLLVTTWKALFPDFQKFSPYMAEIWLPFEWIWTDVNIVSDGIPFCNMATYPFQYRHFPLKIQWTFPAIYKSYQKRKDTIMNANRLFLRALCKLHEEF